MYDHFLIIESSAWPALSSSVIVHNYYGVNVTVHSFWDQELNSVKVNEQFNVKTERVIESV